MGVSVIKNLIIKYNNIYLYIYIGTNSHVFIIFTNTKWIISYLKTKKKH